MNSDFNFIDFTPDSDLRLKCENTLVRLLEMAPFGAMVVSLLQKESRDYRCAIEIYSKFGPFTAQAYDSTPEGALETVARSLSGKLNRWRKLRNLSKSIERMVPDRFTG